MKNTMKRVPFMFLISTLLLIMVTIPIIANNESIWNGIHIQMSTDKTEYEGNEKIYATIELENLDDINKYGIKIRNELPHELKFDELKNENIDVKVLNGKDKVQFRYSIISSIDVKSTVDTYDHTYNLYLYLIFCVSVFALFLLRKTKKGKRIFSILIVALICNTMNFTVKINASSDNDHCVTNIIKIDGVEKEIKSYISMDEKSGTELDKDTGNNVKIDTSKFEYSNDQFYVPSDSNLNELNGTLDNIEDIKYLKYTITDDKNILLNHADIDISKQWYIRDFGFVVGKNILTVSAQKQNGEIIEDKITIICRDSSYLDKIEVDQNDTDGDGLINYLEQYYGTDIKKEDTDNDGLSDYYEIYKTNTNPLKKDTDNNGIDDANEDLDNDGLKNSEELYYNTEPLVYDTDGDDLSDYDEINKYGTNPCLIDTDGDGANDKWELNNGFSPLLYNDNFELSKTNSNEVVNVSVKMNVEGKQIDTLAIEEITDDLLFSEDMAGYITNAFSFSIDGTFDYAEISFELKEKTKDGIIPTIYYFNEEKQLLEEVKTEIIGNRAIAKVNHFSTYVLLNKNDVDKVWEAEIKRPDDNINQKNLAIAFAIDSSGSMVESDPNDTRKLLTKQFVDKIGEKDKVSIIDFDRSSYLLSEFTSDKNKLYSAISKIDSLGGTLIYNGMRSAVEQFDEISDNNTVKVIFLLTDGVDDLSIYDMEDYEKLANKAVSKNITIYTVGLGNVNRNLLSKIAEITNGKYYYATTATDLFEGFENLENETIDFKTDTNQDGISDYYTKLLCDGVLRTGTGIPLFKDATYDSVQSSSDFDNDNVINGNEVKVIESGDKVYLKVLSSPSTKDTDKDGINDDIDSEPLHWNVGTRDLAIFSQLAYQDGTHLIGKMYYDSIIEEKDVFYGGATLSKYIVGDYGISSKWKIVDYVNAFVIADTHFSATTFKNGDDIVIAYRGTDGETGEWISNVIGIGVFNYHIEEGPARIYAKKIAKKYPKSKIYLTGHSLGGYLAQIGATELIEKKFENLYCVEYFNGIGLNFNKMTAFRREKDNALLRSFNANHTLRSVEITNDVVSKVGTHYGKRRFFPIDNHVIKKINKDEHIEYDDLTFGKKILVEHDMVNFFYNISQGVRTSIWD